MIHAYLKAGHARKGKGVHCGYASSSAKCGKQAFIEKATLVAPATATDSAPASTAHRQAKAALPPRSPQDLAEFMASSVSEKELLRLQQTGARGAFRRYKSRVPNQKTRVGECTRMKD